MLAGGLAVSAGNGSIDSMPLNAHVAAPRPKMSPKIVCQRFCPRYGIRRADTDIQIPTTMPRIAVAVPMPDDQVTRRSQARWCLRSGVK